MNYTLEFLLMVDIDISYEDFIDSLRELFPDIDDESYRTFVAESNLIRLRDNDEYDPKLSQVGENGYMHMRYRVEVTPIYHEDADEEKQIALAQKMTNSIREMGGKVVPCAFYEDRLH